VRYVVVGVLGQVKQPVRRAVFVIVEGEVPGAGAAGQQGDGVEHHRGGGLGDRVEGEVKVVGRGATGKQKPKVKGGEGHRGCEPATRF